MYIHKLSSLDALGTNLKFEPQFEINTRVSIA
jgi:hypothetical protein